MRLISSVVAVQCRHGAAYSGHAKVAKLLIEHGLKQDELHEDGFSPFHRACWGTTPGHAATISVNHMHFILPYPNPKTIPR